MTPPSQLTQTDDGPVRLLEMTGRPRRGNPLDRALVAALSAAVQAAEAAPDIRVLILAGSPTHFSVGADLAEVHDRRALPSVLEGWLADFDRLADPALPMVAAVRGACVGGGLELALGCDLVIAADDAMLALPETGLGLLAGQGGARRVLQRAGRSIAADMVLTGRSLSGAEAAALGLVARAVPAAQVLPAALQAARAIAERPAVALRLAREVLAEAADGPQRQAARIERLLATLVLDDPERQARTGAFLDAAAARHRTRQGDTT